MLLLGDLVLLILHISLEVTPLILQFACKFENLRLQCSDLISLAQNLLLHIPTTLISSHTITLQLSLVPCLHFRLLDQHLFFDLINFLLLFNFHLVDNPAILFPQLRNVMH